jgi:RES domain-containing protein
MNLVLADLHDIAAGEAHWSRYLSVTIAPRLITAKLAHTFFGHELRQAAAERDAIVRELTAAFQDPKAAFEGLADQTIAGYQKDWQDFKTHMAAGTLEGRFRAGMIFGKLLIVILGLLTGIVGAARVGAKVASQLPRLVKYAKTFKRKRSAAPVGRASGEAQTPSQLKKEVDGGKSDPDTSIKPRIKPAGVTFQGTVHRYTKPEFESTTWDAHQYNVASNHRYTGPGSGGVYAGVERQTALAEVSHYGSTDGLKLVSKDVRIDNMLDLNNPSVREHIGVTVKDITSNSYEVTQKIGAFAKENGFEGIIAPSARNPGGSNIVVFKGM